MSFLGNLFGGGNKSSRSSSSSSSSRTRDEKSVQADINRALKESGGKWTSGLNDLVAERDRARSGASSGGLASLSSGVNRAAQAVSSIPRGIASDLKMGSDAGFFSNRDKQAANLAQKGYSQRDIQDFFARTDATRASSEAEMAQRRDSGPSAEERAQRAQQQIEQQMGQQQPEQSLPVYRNPFGQTGTTVMPQPGPQPGGVTDAMRREALRIFESQRGAGQVPYQMMPYQQGLGSMRRPGILPITPRMRQPVPMPIEPPRMRQPVHDPRQPFMPSMGGNMQNMQMAALRQRQMPSSPRQADPYDGMRSIGMPVGQPQMPRFQPMPQPRMPQQSMPQQNVSPAFQYAAQNYNRLGGMQRTMDRPMEMMSMGERQRINQMAQGMAGMQRPTQSFGKGMQRPTMPSGKGGANPALLSAMFGSGIGSLRGSGRAMF